MSDNSRNCKTWCVSLVSALLVLAATKSINLPWIIAGIPILPLAFMDAYHLALKLHFRKSYEKIAGYSSISKVSLQEIYKIDPARKWQDIRATVPSSAVWFFIRSSSFWLLLFNYILRARGNFFYYLLKIVHVFRISFPGAGATPTSPDARLRTPGSRALIHYTIAGSRIRRQGFIWELYSTPDKHACRRLVCVTNLIREDLRNLLIGR